MIILNHPYSFLLPLLLLLLHFQTLQPRQVEKRRWTAGRAAFVEAAVAASFVAAGTSSAAAVAAVVASNLQSNLKAAH